MQLSNRLNTFLLVLLVLMAAAIIAILANRAGAGPLDPPGPPSATGTLPQVEPRNPIPPVGWNGTFPIVISQPGSYFLTRNLAPSGATAIDIESSDVSLDLNGFTVGAASCCVTNPSGIFTGSTLRSNVVVRNGIIEGFFYGVRGEAFVRSRFEDLQIHGNQGWGFDIGSANLVLGVMAWGNGIGVQIVPAADNSTGGALTNSVISANTIDGLELYATNFVVRGCVADSNAGAGISVVSGSFNSIEDCSVVGNGHFGVALTGNQNVVVRNNIDGNVGGQVVDSGTSDIIGPLDQANGTNPNDNLGFP